MRATQHNARTRKDGVAFSSKHNDRNFDKKNAPHIDAEKSEKNFLWTWAGKGVSFEKAEKTFYETHFAQALQEKNLRYMAQRHTERCQNMDDYRKNRLSCPEEQILQVGKMGDTIDEKTLLEIALKQIKWEQESFPQCKILDISLHQDEKTPHIHIRKVWIGHDAKGFEVVGQAKALQEMGIDRPDPSKPASRHNNAKQTYTAACRAHYVELCREHGLEIESSPKEASEVGLSLIEYKTRQAQEAEKQALEAKAVAEASFQAESERISLGERKLAEKEKSLTDRNTKLQAKAEAVGQRELSIKEVEDLLKKPFWSKEDKENLGRTALVSSQNAQEAQKAKKRIKSLLNENKSLTDRNTKLQTDNVALKAKAEMSFMNKQALQAYRNKAKAVSTPTKEKSFER